MNIKFPINHFIVSINDKGDFQYFCIDRNSGGYPYWSDWYSSAHPFNAISDAEKEIDRLPDYMDSKSNSISIITTQNQILSSTTFDVTEKKKKNKIAELEKEKLAIEAKIKELR